MKSLLVIVFLRVYGLVCCLTVVLVSVTCPPAFQQQPVIVSFLANILSILLFRAQKEKRVRSEMVSEIPACSGNVFKLLITRSSLLRDAAFIVWYRVFHLVLNMVFVSHLSKSAACGLIRRAVIDGSIQVSLCRLSSESLCLADPPRAAGKVLKERVEMSNELRDRKLVVGGECRVQRWRTGVFPESFSSGILFIIRSLRAAEETLTQEEQSGVTETLRGFLPPVIMFTVNVKEVSGSTLIGEGNLQIIRKWGTE